MRKFNEAISILPDEIRIVLNSISNSVKSDVNEIRLRCGRPILLYTSDDNFFIDSYGNIKKDDSEFILQCDDKVISDTVFSACNKSIYAHTEDIKNGFLTVKGGHRIGFCGTFNYVDNKLVSQKEISSVNIRISRCAKGCADEIMYLVDNSLKNLLICGPPMSGKTTIIREMTRKISIECKYKVTLIDERGEIASCFNGFPQNDVGINTDVISYCRKNDGMMNSLRTLSPNLVVCDELGTEEDILSVTACSTCGVNVISTIHCNDIIDLKNKKFFKQLKECFDYFIFIEGRGKKSNVAKIIKTSDVYD